jgi:hypothetical protein
LIKHFLFDYLNIIWDYLTKQVFDFCLQGAFVRQQDSETGREAGAEGEGLEPGPG